VQYRGVYFYSYLSEPGMDAQTYRFSVRTVATNGTDDGNMFLVEAVVDLSGPACLEDVRASTGF